MSSIDRVQTRYRSKAAKAVQSQMGLGHAPSRSNFDPKINRHTGLPHENKRQA